jgi:hypothetical protein
LIAALGVLRCAIPTAKKLVRSRHRLSLRPTFFPCCVSSSGRGLTQYYDVMAKKERENRKQKERLSDRTKKRSRIPPSLSLSLSFPTDFGLFQTCRRHRYN